MNKGKAGKSHIISGLFVFLILGIFAVFSTLLVLLGANAYRGTVDKSAYRSEERILRSFIRGAVQADDARNVIFVGSEEGRDVIRFEYDFDGEAYVKRLYCADGALRELFTSADREFVPNEGEPIIDAEQMRAEVQNGLLTVTLTDSDGEELAVHVALRAGVQP